MRWHSVAPLLCLGLAPQWTDLVDARPTEECPILGTTFPRAFDLVQTQAFQEARSAFPVLMDELLASGRINASTATIYIDVFSTVTNESVYSYSNAAPAYPDGLTAGVLDEDTVFRIGSVSKLLTAYGILVHAGGLAIFNHPVTWYLPELLPNEGEDVLERVMWQDITIGALAAQMGGSGGFQLAESDMACWFANNCTTAAFLDLARSRRRPVIPPFETTVYSDFGFGILGRVLERLTNLPYNQALQTVLAEPLDLTSTTTVKPTSDDVNAFILPGNASISSWGFDVPQIAPSGGGYSSAKDLRKLGSAILNSELLDPLTTREWLKPRGHTADLVFSVGAPWEISRLDLPVSSNSTRTRVSDLYTKSGGNPGYGSIFGLSPDHGMGLSINVAGEGALTDRWLLRESIVNTFMPAVELAGAENARRTTLDCS